MRKFFRWLFKIFRPDKSGYVKNIQSGSSDNDKMENAGVRGSRKIVSDKDSFYWLPVSKIRSVQKNDQGLTTSIKLSPGFEFYAINYQRRHTLKVQKQGLSRVNYRLEFSLEGDDKLSVAATEFISENKNISILHINRYGDGFLYGEATGLAVQELEDGKIVLEGVEDNVFYEISRECVQTILPKQE